MNDVVVSVKHLTKEVALAQGNTLKVLDDISFDVNQGVFVSIVGPSGSGKSTLLYCISSLLPPSKGKILIKGKSPYEWRASKLAKFRRKEIGFIFQDFQLVSSLSAYDNLLLPGILNGQKIKPPMVDALAAKLELTAELHQSIDALSGGEQQRVAIARTVLADPDIIFLDEPTSALDTHSRQLVMKLFQELVNQGKTLIVVTHDLELAGETSRSIVLRDGRIEREIQMPAAETVRI
ncbi:ABC transporter ATP-binding protein [Lacticaseibacillus paracasei]|uniref:ABC transporter ATP-binding protein n=1 Tax=Lacticaseibacillus paracasei TaxID=1597 RepID=UPI000F43982A|nr:ABC transporter ATP-binding protein [Lacticaseibacillus paracasei]RND36471.1 ABC transporter ATP-binding protein YxdL [Lacticaseibacillus paracasei]